MYGDTINVHGKFPASLGRPLIFTFYVLIPTEPVGGLRFTLTPDGSRKPLYDGVISPEPEKDGVAGFGFAWQNPVFKDPGTYRVRLYIGEKLILTRPIYVVEASPETL